MVSGTYIQHLRLVGIIVHRHVGEAVVEVVKVELAKCVGKSLTITSPEVYSLQCESGPEIVVDVSFDRLQTLEEDYKPQVELDSISTILAHKQHWIVDVLACYLEVRASIVEWADNRDLTLGPLSAMRIIQFKLRVTCTSRLLAEHLLLMYRPTTRKLLT